MLNQAVDNLYGIFRDYAPQPLFSVNNLFEEEYCLKKTYGFSGRTVHYSLRQAINGNLGKPKYKLIEYKIGNDHTALFTVSDFCRYLELIAREDEKSQNNINYACESNLLGLLAERVAWKTTHHFLKSISLEGKLVNDEYEENHIYGNSQDYILKIKNQPNMIILKKESDNPTNYSVIKELDGLFVYEHRGERYVFVLETKAEGLNIGLENLNSALFNPLRIMFPDSRLIYVLFSDARTIYSGGRNAEKRRKTSNRINREPARIYTELASMDVGTMFFPFRESKAQFHEMIDHIIKHAAIINKKSAEGRAEITPLEIKVYLAENQNPLVILRRENIKSEEWHQC